MTEEDLIRLLESRHDLRAAADPDALSDDPIYQGAVSRSREQLAKAREELMNMVAHNTRELSETDTERARAHQSLAKALDHYRYYRGRTEDALLNPPPGQPLDAEELTRRQHLFDRYYAQSPSVFGRMALNKQVEALDALLQAYQANNELHSLGHLPELMRAFRPAIDAVQEYHRETQEDLLATEQLHAARRAFDLAHNAHIRLIESLLTRADRQNDARLFIKRREPSYIARRRSKTSIEQEPELESIESEVRKEIPAIV